MPIYGSSGIHWLTSSTDQRIHEPDCSRLLVPADKTCQKAFSDIWELELESLNRGFRNLILEVLKV